MPRPWRTSRPGAIPWSGCTSRPGNGRRPHGTLRLATCRPFRRCILAALAAGLAGMQNAAAQRPANFLDLAFGGSPSADQPLLDKAAPGLELLIASRVPEVRPAGPEAARLTLGDIPLRFLLHHERRSDIDLYRLRHEPGSETRGEQVRFTWTFPEAFNESMTLDAGALQGQPLHLPDGRIPDNQFTNWGSLFYSREDNLAVGAALAGAEPSRHARRGYSRFTKRATLQLMALTGNPDFELTVFAYRPRDRQFWWAEWYQLRRSADPNLPSNFFPILSAADPSWKPGDEQTVAVIPGPEHQDRRMELVAIDELRRTVAARTPFRCALPVTRVKVRVGGWATGLYRLILAAPGEAVDPAAPADLNRKLTNVVVRPARASAPVLFVAPTDMWWAYATNGGHDYHGWRTAYDGSVGYAPSVMSSRQHRLNHFFYSLYERFADVKHWRYLDQLSRRDGFRIDYATQYDVATGRIRLEDYRLVLIGNHCEFTTAESFRRFSEYLGRGGGVMIHGGDSFAVMVEYLPALDEPRYLWQRGHVWAHLGDQPSGFRPPRLLPADAAPAAPVLQPSAGDARDYLNLFHTTVGYWIPGSRAVIANAAHPVLQGLGVKAGDEVPGPWGGEVDYAYEPEAWDILIRSDRAAPEEREFGVDANDPTPLHRIGLAVHRNERLAMVCGENFPNLLAADGNDLYREIYRRTLHYLLNGARPEGRTNLVPETLRHSSSIDWEKPVTIDTLRYQLPVSIDFGDRNWHRKPAPYAHYTIQGSPDGVRWVTLADRSHGPWRGLRTDTFPPVEIRKLRFQGSVSGGQAFEVRNVEAFGPR